MTRKIDQTYKELINELLKDIVTIQEARIAVTKILGMKLLKDRQHQ